MNLSAPTMALLVALCACTDSQATTDLKLNFNPGTTVDIEFESDGTELSGILDVPVQPAQALVIFVHGYGETDVRGWNMYATLRKQFNALGIATATWDKPGQGRSRGTFDINQPVPESAAEVVAAANYLRAVQAPGSDYMGIWGVSRGGWIAPIALSQDDEMKFWISVSGVTAEDNFPYLLLSNLPYEGGTAEEAELLGQEWREGCELLRTDGSYQDYQAATSSLRSNEYITRMRGGWPSWLEFQAQQANCQSGVCPQVDDEMCSYIHIENFDGMLAALDVDVLALFGEKDLNVDWRKTRAFYQATIAENQDASLTIKTFADADHNINVSETGSIKEMQTMRSATKSEGFYQTQLDWLRERVLARED